MRLIAARGPRYFLARPTRERMHALVTDVHLRNAVSGIRGLGRTGERVMAVGRNAAAAGRWSRYASDRAVAPDVLNDAGGFAAAVIRLALEHGPAVLYPCQEESIEALLDAELPAEAVLPWPSAEVVRAVRDKRRIPELAAGAGLVVPDEHYRGPLGDAPTALPYPVVVKPLDKGQALAHPRAVDSEEQLDELRAEVGHAEPVIVQDLADGPLTAVAVVLDRDGRLVADFHQEARRTWPPGAGPSTLAVSTPPDPELAERCAELLRNAGYWGLAELQFVGTASGPALIDVNARFYGSLALALASGVNFPALWHAVATGDTPAASNGYRAGVTYRWLEGEALTALHGQPGVLLRRPHRPRTGAMWARDDPLPGVLMAGRVTGAWLRRRAARLGGRR
jgi:predicted ATP-grasp superfamily ATP-dependent carboligase